MPALYELVNERLLLELMIEEHGGVLTPEVEDALDASNVAIPDKVEKVALFIRELALNRDAIRAEEERLAERRRTLENAERDLRDYLKRQMERASLKKVNGLLASVFVRENPLTVHGELSMEQLTQLHAQRTPYIRYVPATFALDRRVLNTCVRDNPAMELPVGLSARRDTTVVIR